MIEVVGLEKRFGSLPVLRGVDLRVEPGRITAVWGPNASGKSTLIRIVLGLARADAGRVVVDGEVLGHGWRYRERIGYMPQSPPFPENLSAAELLTMLEDLRGGARRDEDLLESLSLASELTKPLRTLSGGTRQKISAVIAFLFSPDILILDEPTAGLDPIGAAAFDELLRTLQRSLGLSVFLITHDLDTLYAICDRVAVLGDGRVLTTGTLAEVERFEHPWVHDYFHGPRARAARPPHATL